MSPDSVNQTFSAYRNEFNERQPSLTTVQDELDESAPVPSDERHQFGSKPAIATMESHEWEYSTLTPTKKYLWVIEKTEVVFAQEQGKFGKTRKRKNGLSHTNLTQGRPAHAGGEVWFADHVRIVVNGGSGRYRPRSKQELVSITFAFRDAGFDCVSMGWDDDANRENRLMRETPKWKI